MITLTVRSLERRVLFLGAISTILSLVLDILPCVPIVLCLVRHFPHVWTSWVLATLLATVATLAISQANSYLIATVCKIPRVEAFLNRTLPALSMDPDQHPHLARLRDNPETTWAFAKDTVFSSIGRDLILKREPDAHREWLDMLRQTAWYHLCLQSLMIPLLLWPTLLLAFFLL
ncbi:hypothetical protein HZA87_02195 [Candidatus Uhrbacteria bacterium]|nr:hypothetical protein [Candidatus Uhrbacteria bacterium]